MSKPTFTPTKLPSRDFDPVHRPALFLFRHVTNRGHFISGPQRPVGMQSPYSRYGDDACLPPSSFGLVGKERQSLRKALRIVLLATNVYVYAPQTTG